ncbi:hypothetical protein R3P38DRAFT_2800184 [Favolaschia claudopus]|uniref:Uncharacterized protein n=1 Tax=Favolaschia claudopus TaxID=2862362 RepID=A0AAV9ZYP0_9AGAR
MIAVISVMFLLFFGAVRALPLPDRVGVGVEHNCVIQWKRSKVVAMGFEANNAESAKVVIGMGLIFDDSSGRVTTKPVSAPCETKISTAVRSLPIQTQSASNSTTRV